MSRTTVKRVLIGIWAVAFVLGAIGVLWRLRSEHADFGSYIPWGLWIALYAWFVGLSAGAYMLFAAGEVLRIERLRRIGRPALVIAFASLVSGLMIVGLDLGHLERFWHVYLYGNPTSLMAWEISFYTAFGVLLPVTLVLAFRNELARFRPFARFAGQPGVDSPWIRPLALVGGVLAVAVSGATGALFGVVGSRPYWHTGLLPLLFIAAALLSAAAVLTVFAALTAHEKDGDEGEVAFLGRLTLGFLAIATLIEWADVSIAWTQHSQTAAGWAAWDLVLTGPRWWVFWFVHVAAGVLVPVLLLLLRPRRITAVGVAAGLVAVTLVSVRLNVVIPGLAVPQIEGLDEAYAGPGLTFDYTPTLQEWLVSIFTGAFFGGLIGAWYRFVPVRLEAPAQPDALPAGGEGAETRSEFLGKVGIAGGALLASQLPLALHRLGEPGGETNSPVGATPYALARPENIVFSVCQQCNTQCGIKAKLVDGVLVKIDGNPYSPWTMKPPLPFDTPVAQAAAVDGWICPKGQAGIMAAYDPYRIRKVLKRDGPRGSGRWKTIEFDQAVAEIVEGGDHFGEGRVPGLAELWALRDPDLAKEMGADVKAIWDGKLTIAGFKTKHRPHLDVLIDPDHPDLGPKNNQVVFAWGRLKSGRAELLRRFIQESYGSVNAHGHTTVCQGSLYFAGKAMSEQWIDGKWQKGVKAYWQADAGEAEFVIFVGASPFEANYGPPYRTSQITDGLVSGRLKIAVVDPRLSKTAAKAWRWVPAKPGSEGALALALMRWIIENERYDAAFLRNANKAAAEANGEKTWTNASWLVHAAGENEGKLVRASEIGLGEVEERLDPKGNPYEYDQFVVLVDGRPVAVDPADEENAVVGDLVVDTTIRGSRVKSGFQVLTESARSQTLRQWAEVVGVDAALIVELAREFTSHGKKAAADVHRGVSQHTNGYSNVVAWNTLNALVGNYDWAGGMSKSTTYSVTADKDGEPIEGMPFFLTGMHPAKISPFGISSIRHDASYEKSTIFDDYPARRPWYPLSSDVYQEIVPSIGDAYPYSVKALFLYMGSPVYALPGGHTNIEILSDPKRLPLFVANDIVVGETSMYADYVFPDLSYLERWEFAGSHPNVVEKAQPLRQPVIAPLTENVTVFGEEQPLSFEAMLFGLAERLGLPGFGPDGLEEGRPLARPEDYYLLMAANVAAGDKEDPVEPASDEELALLTESRRHLPATVFDAERYRAIVGGEWWPRTATVLLRGGRFDQEGRDGEKLKNAYGKQLNVYQEKTAKAVNAMTGEHYPGVAVYIPAPRSSLGEDIVDGDFPLRLITFREIMHTKSRTGGNYWLLDLLPENHLLISPTDVRELGFDEGDWVRLVSATNPEGEWALGNDQTVPMVGRLKVIEGLRPGVVAFSLGHGHWAYGAHDIVVDGDTIEGDHRRVHGFHGNAAMRVDPHLKNTCLADLTGGSAVFYDTSVRLERASESDAAARMAV
ncbi:MAG TPA: NrfD/PsrC family molybdoenzyme membrane anchor subunit [Gaiellaceae bacterium]|nr:NrfD/PsrC family molybdoenzyme membrane anchor subunit [Gaiellaceae bacterium]